MAIPYSSGTNFNTATCVEAWIEYPFNDVGDTATKVYHHTMRVARNSYTPLAFNDVMTDADNKPPRSPFADDSAAYWVGDSQPSPIDGGNVEFDRVFANVPASRTEGSGIYAFTYPGVNSTVTIDITTSTGNESVTWISATREAEFVFDVATPGDFRIGQQIWVKNDNEANDLFQKKTSASGTWVNDSAKEVFITDITGSTITGRKYLGTGYIDYRSAVTITTFTIVGRLATRDPFTRNATSRTEFSYVKSDNISSVSFSSKFEVLDSNGVVVDTLTSTTIPTETQYLQFITSGVFLNAESTTVERWKGNIWQKSTTTVESL